MKVRIEIAYYVSREPELPIGASTHWRGEGIYCIGKTGDEAKAKLLERIRMLTAIQLPKREIVELESH